MNPSFDASDPGGPRDRDGSRRGPKPTPKGTDLVTDELWRAVAPLLPEPYVGPRRPGRVRLPDRAVLNGVLFVLTTGIGWAKLPSELGYGSGMTCWRRREEWRDAGCWPAIEAAVVAHLEAAGRHAEAGVLRRADVPGGASARFGVAPRDTGYERRDDAVDF